MVHLGLVWFTAYSALTKIPIRKMNGKTFIVIVVHYTGPLHQNRVQLLWIDQHVLTLLNCGQKKALFPQLSD